MELPRAAEQLIRQVRNHDPDATCEPVGDPDGFGRHREVKFDKDTSAWLTPILKIIEDDRIAALEHRGSRHSRLVVCFVGDIRADSSKPYEIEAVDAILND